MHLRRSCVPTCTKMATPCMVTCHVWHHALAHQNHLPSVSHRGLPTTTHGWNPKPSSSPATGEHLLPHIKQSQGEVSRSDSILMPACHADVQAGSAEAISLLRHLHSMPSACGASHTGLHAGRQVIQDHLHQQDAAVLCSQEWSGQHPRLG